MGSEAAIAEVCEIAARHAGSGAAAGRLDDEVVASIRQARLFKLLLPAPMGGLGASLPDAAAMIARVAEADGAAGWAVMIGSGPNWFAGHTGPDLADEVFAPDTAVVAGSGVPGRARRADGGYTVSGHWRWCSGAPWATWFTFTATEEHPDADPFAFAVPADQVTLHPDTWDVRGLRATASWDADLDEIFVADARTFRIDEQTPARAEAIFGVPFVALSEATMAAVSVGVLRGALSRFVALASEKRPLLSDTMLADDAVVQRRTGEVAAAAAAADRSLHTATLAVWDRCLAGAAPTADQRTELTLAACHAVTNGARCGRALRDLAGMSVMPTASPLGRAVADLEAITQNAFVSAARLTEAGAAVLGRTT